jgi:hypothetical protein
MSPANSKDAGADLHLPSRGVAKMYPIIKSTAGDNIIHSGQSPIGMIQMTMQHVLNHTICCFPDELEDFLDGMAGRGLLTQAAAFHLHGGISELERVFLRSPAKAVPSNRGSDFNPRPSMPGRLHRC